MIDNSEMNCEEQMSNSLRTPSNSLDASAEFGASGVIWIELSH